VLRLCAEADSVTLAKVMNVLPDHKVDLTDDNVSKLFSHMADRIRRVASAREK
jgi:hypothetical protein